MAIVTQHEVTMNIFKGFLIVSIAGAFIAHSTFATEVFEEKETVQKETSSNETKTTNKSLEKSKADTKSTNKTETEVTEAPANVEQPQQEISAEEKKYVSCNQMYVEYLKSLNSEQQKKYFDIWWMTNDNEYHAIHNDEFRLKEVKPTKLKEFNDVLKSTWAKSYISNPLILGKYDEKNQGFPISLAMSALKKDHLKSFEVCLTPFTKNKEYEDLMPSSMDIKFVNAKKIGFLKMKPELARQITASFGSDRQIDAQFLVEPVKSSYSKKKLGIFVSRTLQVEFSAKELEIQIDGQPYKVKIQ